MPFSYSDTRSGRNQSHLDVHQDNIDPRPVFLAPSAAFDLINGFLPMIRNGRNAFHPGEVLVEKLLIDEVVFRDQDSYTLGNCCQIA